MLLFKTPKEMKEQNLNMRVAAVKAAPALRIMKHMVCDTCFIHMSASDPRALSHEPSSAERHGGFVMSLTPLRNTEHDVTSFLLAVLTLWSFYTRRAMDGLKVREKQKIGLENLVSVNDC